MLPVYTGPNFIHPPTPESTILGGWGGGIKDLGGRVQNSCRGGLQNIISSPLHLSLKNAFWPKWGEGGGYITFPWIVLLPGTYSAHCASKMTCLGASLLKESSVLDTAFRNLGGHASARRVSHFRAPARRIASS